MIIPANVQKPSKCDPTLRESQSNTAPKGTFLNLIQSLRQQLSSTFPDLLPRIENIASKISDEKFNLVVVGQFKRGKSTLINALVGENLLPTAVVPLTSIVTVLHYGTEEEITVTFAGGRRVTIEREKLSEYVTEKLNPENAKNVEQVNVLTAFGFRLPNSLSAHESALTTIS